jgi:hypothetical protein
MAHSAYERHVRRLDTALQARRTLDLNRSIIVVSIVLSSIFFSAMENECLPASVSEKDI